MESFGIPCHKARIVLELLEEHKKEFQLRSWAPNSPDFDSMQSRWAFIEKQFRDQSPSFQSFREYCLDICFQSSTKHLWHPC
ncbi:hypothetical protein TNCV_178271 [Trichonephila clavipes]|nr:hypothetical protein TNCV_178271 [Trichonephila clavipes]